MRNFRHWLIIAGIAVLMSRVGFYLMDNFGSNHGFDNWRDIKWLAWSTAASVATWTVIWEDARRHDGWLRWAILGLLSPFMGCLFFFPATMMAFYVVIQHSLIVFPIGLTTGLLAAQITTFGRMRGWFGDTYF